MNTVRQLVANFFGEFVVDQLVGVFEEVFQLFPVDGIEIFERDPVIASNIRRGEDAFTFNQLSKLLRRAFERQLGRILRVQPRNCKHLLANAEQQIVSPLNAFSCMRQR